MALAGSLPRRYVNIAALHGKYESGCRELHKTQSSQNMNHAWKDTKHSRATKRRVKTSMPAIAGHASRTLPSGASTAWLLHISLKTTAYRNTKFQTVNLYA